MQKEMQNSIFIYKLQVQ